MVFWCRRSWAVRVVRGLVRLAWVVRVRGLSSGGIATAGRAGCLPAAVRVRVRCDVSRGTVPSKNLRTLNNGWPTGDGPLVRLVKFEMRDGKIYMCCGHAGCPQAIHEMTADDGGSWTWTLGQLRARVADHTLKCHEADIAEATYT